MEIENLLRFAEARRQSVFRRVFVRRRAGPASRVSDKLAFGVVNRHDDAPRHAAFVAMADAKLRDGFRTHPALRKIRMHRVEVLQREAERLVRTVLVGIRLFGLRCLGWPLRFGRRVRLWRTRRVLVGARRFLLCRQLKPVAQFQRCFAKGTPLLVRNEVQNVSATVAGAEAIPAVLVQTDAKLRPVLSTVKRARPAEAVPRALERLGNAEVLKHLEHGDGSLHRLEVHESGHGNSSCEGSWMAARHARLISMRNCTTLSLCQSCG